MPRVSPRRFVATSVAATLSFSACLSAFAPPSAQAITTVPTDLDTSININDARRPGLDTGSIRSISNSRMEGFGNIFVHVDGTEAPRMNDQMVRGFGLTAGGSGTFDSTQSVRLGDVLMTRKVAVDAATGTTSFFDTFTNTGTGTTTLAASFGGSLGYGNAETTAGTVADSTTGDAVVDTADTWIAATTSGNYRPSGVVVGAGVDALGNQQANPFEVAYSPTGSQANDIGFIHELSVEPGETTSLMRFVLTGERGDSTQIVTDTAALAAAPDFSALSTDEICTLENWDLTDYVADCAGADPLDLPAAPIEVPGSTDIAYDVVGKTIAELQADLVAGTVTSVDITQAYLDRIAAYDTGAYGFNSFITVAETALAQAREADEARTAGTTGDLLGIPMGVKDIYDTVDMPTTGGTRALEEWETGADAWQVAKLREAGAVIIGKTNLSEFANSGSFSESGYMQSWNGLFPSKSSFGSSGGSATAVAADLAAATMGTQTGVSLYAPSTGAGLTTFRGTDGLTSTDGVMPLTWATDYAGPMAKDVTDVASILDATASRSTGNNPDDLLTARVDNDLRPEEWKSALDEDSLAGKVIGYRPESFQSTQVTDDDAGATVLAQVTAAFESAGATLVPITGSPTAPPSADYPTEGNAGAEGWERYIAIDRPGVFPYTTEELFENPLNLPYNVSSDYTRVPMDDTSADNLLARRDQYKLNAAEWMDTAAATPVDAVIYPGFLTSMGNNDTSSAIHTADRASGVITQSVGLPTVILPVGLNTEGQTNNIQIVGRAWADTDVLGMGYALEQIVDAHVQSEYAPALEWSGPAESITSLELDESSTTFRDRVSATVTVASDPGASGKVSIEVAGTTVRGTLVDGVATVLLPRKTPVGTHLVTATFTGSDSVAGSEATATLKITRTVPEIAARLASSTVDKGERATIRVTLDSGIPGRVTVLLYDTKSVVKSLEIGHQKNKKVKVPRLAPGRHVLRLLVVAGPGNEAEKSDKLVLKVRS
ncbi:amidase family protein [Nocardioides sp.]|uniref:amidase family protein n=1 Tax=Nocardioides sp. TaxID=35761 RepID=UPI002B2783EC|nr:amidase family protein [Nocardioides sp.]